MSRTERTSSAGPVPTETAQRPVELLSPAGNMEKLRTAYRYGADAAYIGMSSFSLRTRADNFAPDQVDALAQAKAGKLLYGAINIYFDEAELTTFERRLEEIAHYPFDAFIVSDMGIVRRLQRRFPDTSLHLSTQANCLNSDAVRMYRDLGFSRIILGREASLDSVRRIRDAVPDIELEVFVHGAMCLAYSGRCFLSRYMADRSGNRGDCAHSCRWEYRVLEERERPGEYYPIEEYDRYTTILSSKDLCMIDHIAELIDAGVDSLKIEGRMKSAYYTAVVTRAYRKAVDAALGAAVPDLPAYRDELAKVSHRELSTGFYFNSDESVATTAREYERTHIFLGTVLEEVRPRLFRLEVKNQIRQDDVVEYVGPDVLYLTDTEFELLDEKHNKVTKVDHGKPSYLRTSAPVQQGYLIRKPHRY